MASFIWLVALFAVVPAVAPLKLPSYLKACSISDPNFTECARKSGQEGLGRFINGDRKYKVPNLNPIVIPELKLVQGTGRSTFTILMTKVTATGFKDTIVKKIDFDEKTKSFKVFMFTPNLEIISNYNITGRVLLLPIVGQGVFNVTLKQLVFSYSMNYSLFEKNKEKYMLPHEGIVNFEMERAYIDMQNLFNGNKILGDQMNKVLNDNWRAAIDEVGPTLKEAVTKIIDSILKNISNIVPYREIFKP